MPRFRGVARGRDAFWLLVLVLAAACFVASACAGQPPATPTAAADPRALETEVAAKLAATLTAKAPPTASPTPSATPVATPTPRTLTPSPAPLGSPSPLASLAPEPVGDIIAYVRIQSDLSTNVVLSDEGGETEALLTHFVEPQNLCDLGWSGDGQWLVFVSAHDFIHSRNNERNVFVMRADGTGLRMVTGEYVEPEEAQGPFVTLRGRVVGANGPSLVSADGVSAPVSTDAEGNFELVGVPVGARWARAVCPSGDYVLQGDIDLVLDAANPQPVTIEVIAAGRGWTYASLSPDGSRVAAVSYEWALDENGEQQQARRGLLFPVGAEASEPSGAQTPAAPAATEAPTGAAEVAADAQEPVELPLPEGSVLGGLAWSPKGDRVVGTLSDQEGAALWAWDAQGNSLGEILRLEDAADVSYTLADPAWSPDASQIAVVRRDWNWWGEEKRRASILLLPAEGGEPQVLVEGEWGLAAEHPTWTTDGASLYYHVTEAGEEMTYGETAASIWRVRLDDPQNGRTAWRDDGASLLPAIRPIPAAAPTEAPSTTPLPEATPAG